MDLVAAVSPMTCAALVAVVLVKPSVRVKGHNVNIFWVVPFLGAAVLMLCGTISPREVFAGLTAQSSINPLKILVLFLSMTLISIFWIAQDSSAIWPSPCCSARMQTNCGCSCCSMRLYPC